MLSEDLIIEVKKRLSDEDLLCQLAEECSELAQASLKMRRAMTGTNPTPVTTDEAAIIMLVLHVLGYPYESRDLELIQNRKLIRWIKRLDEKRKD